MIDLASARLEAAREAGLAFSGTCSALGDVGYLVDAVLGDVGVGTDFLQHAWIYRPAAALADRQRNVADEGFTVATTRLAPTRDWTDAPESDEAYQVFSLIPAIEQAGVPLSWNRAINAALRRMYYLDEMVIGRGTRAGDNQFSLSASEIVMVAAIAVAGGSGVTITPATGWTLIRRTNSGTDLAFATYWKRAHASDAEVFTFTLDTSRAAVGGVMAYLDANVSDPVDDDGQTTTASSVTATAPAVTASVLRGRVLHAYGAVGSVVVATPAADYERFDGESTDSDAAMSVALSDRELSGAQSTLAAEATLGAAAISIGHTIILQPLTDARDVAPVSRGTADNNGAGATTLGLRRPSSLPNDDWAPTEGTVRRVLFQDANGSHRGVNQSGGGRDWRTAVINGQAGVRTLFSPGQDSLVVAEVHRPYASLTADTDVTACPLDRLVPMAIWQAYELLNKSAAGIGHYTAEAESWFWRAEATDAKYRPPAVIHY